MRRSWGSQVMNLGSLVMGLVWGSNKVIIWHRVQYSVNNSDGVKGLLLIEKKLVC